MLSQTAEYALRAVVWLATDRRRALSTHEISSVTKVPAGYLSKVLQSLARAGLVVSAPGRQGGFLLTRSADRITVLDVVNALGGVPRIRRCPLGLRSHGVNLCPLHRRLDHAMELVEEAYASATIAELLAEPTHSKPLYDGNLPSYRHRLARYGKSNGR